MIKEKKEKEIMIQQKKKGNTKEIKGYSFYF